MTPIALGGYPVRPDRLFQTPGKRESRMKVDPVVVVMAVIWVVAPSLDTAIWVEPSPAVVPGRP